MALLDFEGFDLFGNFAQEYQGKFLSISGTPTLVTGRGTEGKALRLTSGVNHTTRFVGDYAVAGRTIIIGMAVNASSGHALYDVLRLTEKANNFAVAALRISAAGVVGWYNSGALVAEANIAIQFEEWVYIEAKVKLASSGNAGSVTFRINGADAGATNNVNTVSGITGLERVAFGYPNYTLLIDDFYFCDDTGPLNNDFLGPRRVLVRTASSTASNTMPTLVGAATAHGAVSEIGPDEDASYIAGDAAGMKALFGHAGISTDEVNGVRTVARVKKSDVGARAVRAVLHSGASEVTGGVVVPGTATYQYVQGTVREVNPTTGATWTPGEVNVVKFGVEVR